MVSLPNHMVSLSGHAVSSFDSLLPDHIVSLLHYMAELLEKHGLTQFVWKFVTTVFFLLLFCFISVIIQLLYM